MTSISREVWCGCGVRMQVHVGGGGGGGSSLHGYSGFLSLQEHSANS